MGSVKQSIHAFDAHLYKRHNSRRQEHLASLNLPIRGKTVLEVGAGTGDHSSFFIDRECDITITEARKSNIGAINGVKPTLERVAKSIGLTLQKPPTKVEVRQLDLDNPPAEYDDFDICYFYGALYHLEKPAQALKFCGDHCDLLLLETCISFGEEAELNPKPEPKINPTQSFSGVGNRATRRWVFDELKKSFPHVYIPHSVPNHVAYPIDFDDPKHKVAFVRAVFIASKTPLDNPLLCEGIPRKHFRH